MTNPSIPTKENLMKIVGSNIKRNRLKLKLSQEAFAERIGVSKNFISQMETGLKYPSAETIAKLCSVFDIEYFELFFDFENLCPEAERERLKRSFCSQFEARIQEAFDGISIFK